MAANRRIGVLGVGFGGDVHVPGLRSEGWDVAAIYSRNEQNIGKFAFVFAFEILEHLMNPLSFLEFLKSCLTDNGRIFLSTPFLRPRFLWSKYHITEYFPDKIEAIATKAGLRVKRYKRKKAHAYRTAIQGIRPMFRALWFERIILFELEKH